MPAAYSNDLRKRVIDAINNGKPVSEVIDIFGVCKSTVYNWENIYEATGEYKPMPHNPGRKSKVTDEQEKEIQEKILAQPDITLEELKESLNLSVCISALCRIVNNKLKLKYKKNTACKRAK